jgi:RNA polymerase sigma-70 factor (ECF subfamily)
MSPLMVNSPNLNQIINLCLKGDRKAQEQLFHSYSGVMLTICRRYTSNIQEAEDMLQEGFIRIFTHMKNYERSGSFEGWMKKIFINTALRTISKKSSTQELNGYEVLPEESVEPSVVSRLSEEQLLDLISELPKGYRAVFNLYAIEGYSHREISEMLGMEESTSRSQLVKARRMLQDKFIELQKIAV